MGVHTSFPSGIWKVMGGGTTAGTLPVPASDTNFGEIVVSGTATLMWIKKPAAGDQFVAEVQLEITSLTGGLAINMQALLNRTSTAAGELWGNVIFPSYDRTITVPNQGFPGKYIPRKLTLRSMPFTLADPGVTLRYVGMIMLINFMTGGSATILFKEVNLIRVS